MDARIFSLIRRDGRTIYGLNIYASIFLLIGEIIFLFVLLILIKVNAGVELLITFGALLIVFPVAIYKYYKKVFKYYSVVRCKDIINEILKPSSYRCNNYYVRKVKLSKVSIEGTRKKGA